MKKISAYEIALSALSCALSTLFLTLGVYSGFFLFTAYLLASIALILPLCKRSWRGYLFAYVVTCLLSLLFASFRFWELIPFAMFFGLHPLVNELQLKLKINRWLAFFVKAVWFDGTVYFTWKLVFAITTPVAFVNQYILPIILVVGTLVFLAYDYFMFKWRVWANGLVSRISKK
ncbi:MAG: hypothetical protein E7355_04380 [Clostridiales bacterium]|nr:hypothetical protein [Clostridiales bacterium]